MKYLFNIVAVVGCLSISALAEEQQITVSTTDSGRLYADYTFGDCCTLDAWDSQSSSVWTDNCGTMGGYCSDGRDVALWTFEVPELPEGAELLEVRQVHRGEHAIARGAQKPANPCGIHVLVPPVDLFLPSSSRGRAASSWR